MNLVCEFPFPGKLLSGNLPDGKTLSDKRLRAFPASSLVEPVTTMTRSTATIMPSSVILTLALRSFRASRVCFNPWFRELGKHKLDGIASEDPPRGSTS